MKFNKVLTNGILKEWRFYSVDYKAMKKYLKHSKDDNTSSPTAAGNNHEEFFKLYADAQDKVQKFYNEREKWAFTYMTTLEERVETLRKWKVSDRMTAFESESHLVSMSSGSENTSIASGSEAKDHDEEMNDVSDECLTFSTTPIGMSLSHSVSRDYSSIKEEYRQVGKSKHFNDYIYAKKSLATFERELELLLEFLDLNKTGFSKILKKFDKRTGSSIRESYLDELGRTHQFLEGNKLRELKGRVSELLKVADEHRPQLPDGWEARKVYTIGCFDLFHRGHQNVLNSLREFGYFIVAGIHDDESYFQLKNKYTIDNLETRMKNVKPFVDQLFVIPSTNPDIFLKCMVSEQDILTGSCCYARGDDMLNFPGREWVESVMPVHFVPRTESCSSSLLRTIYHSEDPELAKKAAFAVTNYDGKPIDENGNVLKQ